MTLECLALLGRDRRCIHQNSSSDRLEGLYIKSHSWSHCMDVALIGDISLNATRAHMCELVFLEVYFYRLQLI